MQYFFFRKNHEDYFETLREKTKMYGHVYGTYQGLKPVLRISSREHIKEALSQKFYLAFEKTMAVKTGSELWDNDIYNADYKTWRKYRPLSSHVLTGLKLRAMKSKLERVANRLAAKLQRLAQNNAQMPTKTYAQGAVMDAVAAVSFSLEVDALEDPHNPFVKHSTGLFDGCLGLTVLTAFPHMLENLPFVQFPSVSTERFFMDFALDLLRKRRKESRKRDDPDALDAWLEVQTTNPDLTDAMMISQMFVFLTAGYETSAYVLMYVLYLLATHPKTQENIFRDIEDNISDGDSITFEQYHKMKLLEAAIYETLRLYPTDHAIDRVTVSSCTIAGVPLDPHVGIQVPLSSVHMDPERFPEPTKFRPERFLDGGGNVDDMVAFGDGPRKCVGQRLAIFQMLVLLVAFLRVVRLEPADDDEFFDPSLEYQSEIERVPGQIFMPFPKRELKIKLAPRKSVRTE
ncbi:cytochrome P450 3A14-like [Galendromus occidentalis]|uniref:Cytochrome P450 3A14-like n=1 Tax=Galendromus occidentalis TaxID=34638 RepID=A0AAJ6QTJ4_9ACAR|nr:cytochrome P450 3A14-like [Galendromus occidentalis]